MSKQDAIRTAAYHKFVELAPKRVAGEFGPTTPYLAKGNTAFRLTVCNWLATTFGLTLPQTSPHYNFAFQVARGNLKSATLPAVPHLCEGLGRPADKLGGRKRNNAAPAAATTEGADAAASGDATAAAPAATLGAAAVDAAVADATAAAGASGDAAVETQQQAPEEQQQQQEPEEQAQQQAPEEQQEEQQAPTVERVNVVRASDGAVVLEQVTRDEAEAAIAANKKAKKAKLVIA